MFFKEEEIKVANKSVRKLVTLKKNYEFQYVFKKGKRFSCLHFNLIVAQAKKNFPKIGIVISKKIGKAVVRNKKRRQIKEILRKFIGDVVANQYVIVAKNNIVDLKFIDLEKEVFECFRKNNFVVKK